MWCHRRWGDDKDNNVLDDDDDVETGGDGDAAHDEDDGYEDGNWTCDTGDGVHGDAADEKGENDGGYIN